MLFNIYSYNIITNNFFDFFFCKLNTFKQDTSLINFEKKDAATEEYKNSPDQFKGRFESKTIVTEDGEC